MGCQVSPQRAFNIFHTETRNCTITLISVVPDLTDSTLVPTILSVYTSLLLLPTGRVELLPTAPMSAKHTA